MGNQISKDIEQAKIFQTAKYGTRTQRLTQSRSLDNQLKNYDIKQNTNSVNYPKVPHVQIKKDKTDKIPQKDPQNPQNSLNNFIKSLNPQYRSEKKVGEPPNLKYISEKLQAPQRHEKSNSEAIRNIKRKQEVSMRHETDQFQQNSRTNNIKTQQKINGPKMDINWATYKLEQKKPYSNLEQQQPNSMLEQNQPKIKSEQNQRGKNFIKKKNKSYEYYDLISSDEERQKSSKSSMMINQNNVFIKEQQQSISSSSSFQDDLMIDEQEEIDNEQSEMVDQELEQGSRKVIKNQAKIEQEEQSRLKVQYSQKSPQQLGIFEWNQLQDNKQMQLEQEETLLFEFQNQVKEKGKIQSPHLLSKIKQKVYLKSIDALAQNFNYNIFSNLSELKNHQELIKVGFRKEKKYGQVFGQLWQINDFDQDLPPVMHVFEDQYGQNLTPSKINLNLQQGEKLQLVFMLASDMIVGSSRLITNINQKIKSDKAHDLFYKSLQFLIKNEILQVQTAKVSESPYKFMDGGQIYQSTRAAQKKQNQIIWKKKMEADYEITIPLTLNLPNYYNYICRQKLSQQLVQDKPDSQAVLFQLQPQQNNVPFSIQPYRIILKAVQEHIRIVLSFLNKSKQSQAILNEITKTRLLSSKPLQIQAPQQKDDSDKQQSEDEYDLSLKIDKLNPSQNRFSDQQVSKQKLQKLFQSGNWFSLHSSKVQCKNPSPYFKGQLKKYQQLTLAWMLYRQNCPINYQIDRPHQHFKWQSFHRIGQPQLYRNFLTGQILNFIPYWKKKVRGGMLCDEMGLGKTVMSLALIDSHVKRVKKHPQKQAGTLIIVPTVVLTQWKAKINEFLPHLKCLIVSQGKDVKMEEILRSDIVLTTFGIILSQQKKSRKFQFDERARPTLYEFDWFRVIVDEADNLRNKKTKSAQFIRNIQKQYVWLLTGTPIQNKLSDLQSYFRLLQYQNHGLIKAKVKKGFIKNNKSLILIKQTLKDIMVRRKKDALDEDGKPILELKQCKWNYHPIQFTPEQKNMYDAIQGKIVHAIDKIIQQDKEPGEWDEKIPKINRKLDPSVNQGIQHVFGKLMKLRQFCCHPQLLHSKSTFIKYEQFTKRYEFFCKNGFDVKVLRNLKAKGRTQEKQIFRRIFLSSNQIQRQMYKNKVHDQIMSRQKLICTYCQDVIRTGILTPCLHLYCQDCFQLLWTDSQKQNRDKFQILDPGVKKIRIRKYMICHNSNCNEKIYHRQTLQLPRFNRFNKKIQHIQSNKKIDQLIKLIRETQPQQKIVVYTHFIGMIQILQHIFKTQIISALKLVGNDSIPQRDQKLKAFRENDDIKVMLISTKCGYAGLNLQIANKLYFMDPWWNPAVEDQAMGRLHRYGQENKVQATRFIIDGSIEEIINLMGNQKKLLSDFVLDSDCSKKRKKKVEWLQIFRNMLDAKIKGI